MCIITTATSYHLIIFYLYMFIDKTFTKSLISHRVPFSSLLTVVTFLFLVQDINQIEIERLLVLVTLMLSNIWKATNQNMASYIGSLKMSHIFCNGIPIPHKQPLFPKKFALLCTQSHCFIAALYSSFQSKISIKSKVNDC